MIRIHRRDSGALLHKVDGNTLAGARLAHAVLLYADLPGADFSGADLRGVDSLALPQFQEGIAHPVLADVGEIAGASALACRGDRDVL